MLRDRRHPSVLSRTKGGSADGDRYLGVSVIELRDGKVVKETDYYAQPFQAPEWRAQWVERM
jgi:hypothetical protein